MGVLIAHEAPKSIFNEIQEVTNYDYFLVHLFEQDQEYFNLAKKAVTKGREVILDNSIFELEEAFDADRFAYWIDKLRPTWYVVPDALEDVNSTMTKMKQWNEKFEHIPGKKVGVVQGKTYYDIVRCYEYMNRVADVDMIAISFDYSYYTASFPHPNKYISWCLGRVKLLGDLVRDGIINTDKKHHLLGSSLPQEGLYYRQYPWIYSMDTSNPVVHGIKAIEYSEVGLFSKESQKLFEMINLPYEDIDLNRVLYNVHKFKYFWNGKRQ